MGEDAGTWLSLRGKKHQINFLIPCFSIEKSEVSGFHFLDFREKKIV